MRRKYANVAVPTELLDTVRGVVEEQGSFYTSMADFVKEALREKLERLALSGRKSSGA